MDEQESRCVATIAAVILVSGLAGPSTAAAATSVNELLRTLERVRGRR
jgi:hypothetical protein